MRFLFLLLSFAVSLFATNYEGEIYTWGYGELIKNVLDSIHMLVNGSGLASIFKIAMGIGFLLFALKKATDGRGNPAIEFGKFMLFATAVWYLFLNAPNDAKHRYVIIDKVTGEQWVAEQIPTGIGEPLSIITTFEDRVIAAMEKVFSLPQSISYRNSGFGFPLRDQYVLGQLSTPDIYFTQTFKAFITNCTINEITDGSKDIKAIVTANDLLSALNPDGDTRLTKIYSQADPDGKTVQCTEAYSYIINFLNTNNDNLVKLAAARLKTTPQTLLDRTDAVPQLFFNVGESARDYINQNFLINLTKTAFSAAAAESGLSSTQIAYATAIAKQNMQNKFAVSGILAREYIPIIKGVMLTIIVALSWVMALFAVIHLDFRYISMYFTLLLWLMLWSPIFVILNYIGDTYVAKIFSQITQDTGQVLTMYNFNFVNSKVTNTLGWLGYLSWLVPPLAFAIAKASERGFVSFISSMSQSTGAAAGAGASAVTSKGTQATPEYRIGDSIYKDVPGGMQQLSYAYAGGHQFSVTQTKTGGLNNVSANIDGGMAQAMASFAGGGVTSATFSSKNISASVTNSLQSQASQKLKEAKSQLESEKHSYQNIVSGEITTQINSKDGFSLTTDKSMSLSERRALNETILNDVKHSIGDNTAYQKVYEKAQKAAASGSLGIEIKSLMGGKDGKEKIGVGGKAGAGGEIIFMDGNKVVGTIKLDEAHFKAFEKKFSQTLSKDLAENETARKGFYKSLDKNEAKNFSQSARESEELSIAYSKLRSAEKEYSYVTSHGANISQNALSLLFMDELKEIKSKHPEISNEKAVELASNNILKYQQDGILMQELKERGYLDINKPDLSGVENNVDKHIDTKLADKVKDEVGHTKDEIEKNGKRIDNVVKENSTTSSELKEKFNQTAKNFHNSDVKLSPENEKYLNKVKKDVNKNVIDNANDVKNQIGNTFKEERDRLNPQVVKYEGWTTMKHNLLGTDIKIKEDTIAIRTNNGLYDTGIPASAWHKYLETHPEIADKLQSNKGVLINTEMIKTYQHKTDFTHHSPFDKPDYDLLSMELASDLANVKNTINPLKIPSKDTDLSINTEINPNSSPSSLLGDINLAGNSNIEKEVNYIKRESFGRFEDVIGDQRKTDLYKNNVKNGRVENDLLTQKPSDFIP